VGWRYQQALLRKAGKKALLDEVKPKLTGWRGMKMRKADVVLLIRTNDRVLALERDLGDEITDIQIIWSKWRGYWDEDRYVRPMCDRHGLQPEFLHTSGHASWDDLKRLVRGLRPGTIIPVHTENASRYAGEFPNVRLPDDGQEIEVWPAQRRLSIGPTTTMPTTATRCADWKRGGQLPAVYAPVARVIAGLAAHPSRRASLRPAQ
jgi:hypothetical protein